MLDERTTIDEMLHRVRTETDDLPTVVRMLRDEPAEVRDVWHWQWDSLMSTMSTLHQQRLAGRMSDVQERDFLALSLLLSQERTWLEALGCSMPDGIVVEIAGDR